MFSTKLLLVGPSESGKTVLANFLSDATEAIGGDYNPTQGVRILEFECLNVNAGGKNVGCEVELWDCSGDQNSKGYMTLNVFSLLTTSQAQQLVEAGQIWAVSSLLLMSPTTWSLVNLNLTRAVQSRVSRVYSNGLSTQPWSSQVFDYLNVIFFAV
ncbi:intraflagellar transport protein 22 homolog isoform X4 [Hemitrygon akajei]|uniref:intraflagellar transport protein 22 homolog isoform X4 n=1 Tax=Hemitrygon akajei TaxID=2704970 RepID=UPI003BF940F4